MLPRTATRLLSGTRAVFRGSLQRNFGATAVVMEKEKEQELDPIQALFIEKIQAYKMAALKAGDDLVDATDEFRARRESEMEKLVRMYQAETGHMESLPDQHFDEPLLDDLATSIADSDLRKALTS